MKRLCALLILAAGGVLSAQGHPGIQQKTGDLCVWAYDFDSKHWLCNDATGSTVAFPSTNCANCPPSCPVYFDMPDYVGYCGGPIDGCTSGVLSTGCFYNPSTYPSMPSVYKTAHLYNSPIY